MDLHCLSKEASKTNLADDKRRQFLVALKVNKCAFQFIYGHDFHEMHARLRGSNILLTMLTLILPDLPSRADKIVEPRPDMNI